MGSPESSNSNRLVEVAKSCGIDDAYLIEGADNLKESMFNREMVIGLSSGASTPEIVVQEVISKLKDFGANKIEELNIKEEYTRFPLQDSLEFTTN